MARGLDTRGFSDSAQVGVAAQKILADLVAQQADMISRRGSEFGANFNNGLNSALNIGELLERRRKNKAEEELTGRSIEQTGQLGNRRLDNDYELGTGHLNLGRENLQFNRESTAADQGFRQNAFDRGIFESDRGFGRGVEESDRLFGFNKEAFDADNLFREKQFRLSEADSLADNFRQDKALSIEERSREDENRRFAAELLNQIGGGGGSGRAGSFDKLNFGLTEAAATGGMEDTQARLYSGNPAVQQGLDWKNVTAAQALLKEVTKDYTDMTMRPSQHEMLIAKFAELGLPPEILSELRNAPTSVRQRKGMWANLGLNKGNDPNDEQGKISVRDLGPLRLRMDGLGRQLAQPFTEAGQEETQPPSDELLEAIRSLLEGNR